MIDRLSWNREAQIGNFYDCRTEKLFQDETIFKNPLPENFIIIAKSDDIRVDSSSASTLSKSLKLLKLEDDAMLSVLCGMVDSDLMDFLAAPDENAETFILVQTIQTSQKGINFDDPKLKDLCKKEFTSPQDHIVAKIIYGSQTIIKLTYHKNDGSNIQEKINNDFSELFQLISMGDENLENSYFSYLPNLSIKVQSNLEAEIDSPKTITDLLNLLRNIKLETKNTEKQLLFHLIPFSELQEKFSFDVTKKPIFNAIEESTIKKRISPIFNDIDDFRMQMTNLQLKYEQNQNFLASEELKKLQENIQIFEDKIANFKKALSAEVIKFRSEANCDELELILLCREFSKTFEDLKKSILNDFKIPKKRIEYLSMISKLGITIVQNLKEFEAIKSGAQTKEVYLFSFTFSHSHENPELAENFQYFCSLYNDRKRQSHIDMPQSPSADRNFFQQQQAFIVVEGDISPEIFLAENFSPNPCISKIEDGKIAETDLLQNKQILDSQCIAKCDNLIQSKISYNFKRQIIQLRCPNTLKSGKCTNKTKIWYCSQCCGPLEYGFDEKFYCLCGFQSIYEFQFKCNEESHGSMFMKFENPKELKMELSNVKEREEINIVVLGESGVGKSTWINSVATYLTFDTFEDAKAPGSSLITLVPTKFSFEEQANGKNLKISVSTGSSANECFETGQSATKSCRAYHIPWGDKLIRIIDTPGILDTAGMDQDKKNLENTLTFLGKYHEIHAICILCMANRTRLTDNFEYCFNELFTQFHISAGKNFLFCYTNVALSGYQAGGTGDYIKKLLAKIKEKRLGQKIDVECESADRAYMFDNMGYRYLCAFQADHMLKIDEESKYAKSYRLARDETLRLFKLVKTIRPHNTVDSVSIFRARNITFRLTKPLIKIGQAQKETMIKRERRQREIEKAGGDLEKLRKILGTKIPTYHYRLVKEIGHFCVRCQVRKEYWGEKRKKFSEADPRVYDKNPLVLMQCHHLKKSADGTYYCKNCGKDYIYHQCSEYFTKEKREEKENDFLETERDAEAKQKTKEELEKQIKEEHQEYLEIQEELKIVVSSTAKFYYFLKTRSLVPHNDAAERYIESLIKVEEIEENDPDKLQALIDLKAMLQKEKERLDETSVTSGEEMNQVTPEDVEAVVAKLQSLKHYGPDIEHAAKENAVENNGIADEPYISYVNQYLHNKNKIHHIIEGLTKK